MDRPGGPGRGRWREAISQVEPLGNDEVTRGAIAGGRWSGAIARACDSEEEWSEGSHVEPGLRKPIAA